MERTERTPCSEGCSKQTKKELMAHSYKFEKLRGERAERLVAVTKAEEFMCASVNQEECVLVIFTEMDGGW